MKINLCTFIFVLLLSSMAFANEEIIAHGEIDVLEENLFHERSVAKLVEEQDGFLV